MLLELPYDRLTRHFVIGILIAFLPAAIIGALAHDFIEGVLFETPKLICIMLILGGLVLFWVDRWALNIEIGEPELWNRGLGTRAVVALLRYLFVEKGAAEVVLSPVADNARAIRSYEKAGFRKVRLITNGEFLGGEWRDAWLMSVQPDRPD